ncbi:hypothetical protein ACJ73_08508 [Blastomyces percursus]|uniref:Uncharacterized protein n=1 Tax=Blastomyces percursus TaxID=1658174 RepID=A0A1J9QVC2_9EURO|nr:hypothetical protein ACJ73_08508 [Blastomyces percursus]
MGGVSYSVDRCVDSINGCIGDDDDDEFFNAWRHVRGCLSTFNFRSGGTPDLTKEYVPTRRRNPETPEAQGSNAGLPTPATDRRTKAPGGGIRAPQDYQRGIERLKYRIRRPG